MPNLIPVSMNGNQSEIVVPDHLQRTFKLEPYTGHEDQNKIYDATLSANGLTVLPYATDAATAYLVDTQSILISPPVQDIPTSVTLKVEDLSVTGEAALQESNRFGSVMHEIDQGSAIGGKKSIMQETGPPGKQKNAVILDSNSTGQRSCSSVQQEVEVLSAINQHHCKSKHLLSFG